MKPQAILQIDKNPSSVLRLQARAVTQEEFGSPLLRDVIRDMQDALKKEEDGVALAAPQIGISLRIFVVASSSYEPGAKDTPLVFINPKIIKHSKKRVTMQEGCLSVRWIYGKTYRYTQATVEAYDVEGRKFTFGGSGLIAHIFQHEIDHLDGILFIDHGFDLEEYTEEDIKKNNKK
ncbi:MAG: hypothetical protein RI935_30 [Candidatus Parcubacteria bacterium]|jgi:peptide deformylase